ncbi:MAG: ATP-dependent DNA helicase [Patescibacteria group bacterium]|nr:ATP-dependent DNA helicase [Patescibacteria group bacterium]
MSIFKTHYKKLNTGQKKAVDSLEGPVMVAAGPGTGKTEVLALRIVNLIRQKKANPEEILALTFSNSATVSMRRRVTKFLGAQAYNIGIKTFHSFCNDVISQYPDKFVLLKELSQLNELESIKIIKTILRRGKFKQLKPFYSPYCHQKEIISTISQLKQEGVSPKELESALETMAQDLEDTKKINPRTGKPTGKWQTQYKQWEKLNDLLKIYQEYLEKTHREGWYDFSDMITWVTEKLKEDQELRNYYRDQFKYILSDEYQDTNIPQSEVIEILGKPQKNPNIFIVGDDDQSIYRFQGASLDNIISFEKKYPTAKIIPLNINYRSQQKVVSLSKTLIEKNEERLVNVTQQAIDKNIQSFAEKEQGGQVSLAEFSESAVEDYFIAQKIKELHKKGIPFKEMAIINRTNQDVSQIADYLIKAGIPVEMSSTGSILDKKETKEIMSLLAVAVTPHSNAIIYEAMSLEVWEIEPRDFLEFTYQAGKEKINYFDFFNRLESESEKKSLENTTKWQDFKKIKFFFETVARWHQESVSTPAILMLEKVINDSGLIKSCLEKKDIRKLNRIFSLFSFVKENNRKNPFLKLKSVINDLEIMREDRLTIKEKELSMAEDDVRVITAHAAKGLEFEVVFIPRLYQGNWDGKRKNQVIKIPWNLLTRLKREENESAKSDDERRLFFVALTRAKSQLFLSRADRYDYLNSSGEKTPSRFLAEIDSQLVKKCSPEKYEDATLARMKIELKKTPIVKKGNRLKQETSFLRQRVEDLALSPTSLNLYLNCPRRYKYEKLLMIPSAKNKAASLGTAIHEALEKFFQDFQKDKKVNQASLISFFREAVAKEVLAKSDLEDMLREGERLLNDYYAEYSQDFVKPVELEMSFGKVYLSGASATNKKNEKAVLLTGKIDKIEKISQQEKTEKGKIPVKVIDYKTGMPQTKNQILGNTKNSSGDVYRQMVFYKLLSLLDKKFPYSVTEVEVDFIKSQNGRFRRESFEITKEETDKLQKQINEVVRKIKNLEFGPTKDTRNCQRCDLKDLCSLVEE